MKRKLFFIFIAALLLMPCMVAYANDSAAAATAGVDIAPAAPDSLPKFNAYGHAIGGVTPGDLFLIDISSLTDDARFSLYITNTDELVPDYRYLTLNLGTYIQTDTGEWEMTPGAEDGSSSAYLTMHNGTVSFVLAGGAKYKITIERGCFYCYGSGADGKLAVPNFYISAG